MDFCYFDNNASSQPSKEVIDAMLPFLRDHYANASSIQHRAGRLANQAIEKAREQVAALLQASPKEITFTSGATEAINTAILGVAQRYQKKGKRIICSSTEHQAVLQACQAAQKHYGAELSYLPVNQQGEIDLNELQELISEDCILVCIMAANNQTGTIHPIDKIAKICREKDVLYFCDATQYIGKCPIDLSQVPIDLLCLSAHKMHGPKGAGALFIRNRPRRPIQVEPLLYGGEHENGQRAGTYAVPQIVGMGAAAAQIQLDDSVKKLRDRFEQEMIEKIPLVDILSKDSERLDNTSCLYIPYVPAQQLMTRLPNIAFSAGSACAAASPAPSHVLLAMGLDKQAALNTVRFSFSKNNTLDEILFAAEAIGSAVEAIRKDSPIWQMHLQGLI